MPDLIKKQNKFVFENKFDKNIFEYRPSNNHLEIIIQKQQVSTKYLILFEELNPNQRLKHQYELNIGFFRTLSKSKIKSGQKKVQSKISGGNDRNDKVPEMSLSIDNMGILTCEFT